MNIFLTSDTHFDHRNVIEYCKRPFIDVEDMNEELVKRWNEVVQPEDIVWHLGDFSLNKKALRYVERLKGSIYLIPGNHDSCFPMRSKHEKMRLLYLEAGFTEVYSTQQWLPEARAWMWHLPYSDPNDLDLRYPEWRPKDLGGRLLCGHVHDKWKTKQKMINVGVDQWDYKPVALEEINLLWPKGFK